jgi:hypothetical protein
VCVTWMCADDGMDGWDVLRLLCGVKGRRSVWQSASSDQSFAHSARRHSRLVLLFFRLFVCFKPYRCEQQQH